jgi:P-type conjugative transfer protein TrbJ
VQAFETEGLIGTGAAPAVLAYLFHRIEDRLDGRPTLLIIDEGWLALDDDGFAGQLREWLKTLRKKNASVIFATQSLSDIDGSHIAPAIIESCQTRSCCRTSARSSRRSPRSIAASASTTARSRSSRGPCPSATITASRGAATACSSWACPTSRSRSAPPPPRPTRPLIARIVAEHGRDGFLAAWLRHAASAGPPTSSPTSPISSPKNGEVTAMTFAASFRAARLARRAAPPPVALAPMLARRLRPRHAQWIVYDPSNYAQNVLTAARTLQQINNQITSLQNEAQMLINQARNLASLPYSSLQQLQQSVQRTQQLLSQAQNIAYDVQQIDQAFQSKYGNVSMSASDQQLVADARSRWQNTVGGLQDAMRVQAGVVGNIDTNRARCRRWSARARARPARLQATQAGNQLLALQAQQLADLTAVVAANGRAQALTEAEQAAAAEQGREQRRRFLTPGTGYQPGNAQMFHGTATEGTPWTARCSRASAPSSSSRSRSRRPRSR